MKMIKGVVLSAMMLLAGQAVAGTTYWVCDVTVSGNTPKTFSEKGSEITDYGNSFKVNVDGKELQTPSMNRWDQTTNVFSVSQNGVVMKMRPLYDMRYYIEDQNRGVFFKFTDCVEE